MPDKDSSDTAPSCPYRPSQPNETHATDRHPFVTFKHFIDDQISSIARLATFPDLRKSMQQARAEVASRNAELQRRWTGRDETADHDEMLVQRMDTEAKNEAYEATLMLMREAVKRHSNTDPARIRALYTDSSRGPMALEHDRFASPQLSFGGACYYMPESGDNFPTQERVRYAQRFLSVDWFKQSCYSPINVEADLPDRCWRVEFEDLLTCSLNGPATNPRDRQGLRPNFRENIQSVRFGPGLDWMLSLYCRGILPLTPRLSAVIEKNDVSTLAAVRQQWSAIAGGWGPDVAEREMSDLVRAVASPPAPAWSITTSADIENVRSWKDSLLIQSQQPVLNVPQPEIDTTFKKFIALVRDGIMPSAEAKDFWQAVSREDANKAADIVVRWEGKGRDVRDLIDDELIVEDYLEMETHPALWAMCEALEKAHSELMFEQAANLTKREKLDSVYESVLSMLHQQQLDRSEVDHESRVPEHAAPRQQTIQDVGILSALTTTQTTRMPDGSVTTKVVLKKRFADGREETTESVKVEHAKAADTTDATKSAVAEKKSNWFWS